MRIAWGDALTTAYASGKVILFGEHAVVYGRPAIAAPVTQVHACATVEDAPEGQGLLIRAVDLKRHHVLGTEIGTDHPAYPLEATVRHTLQWLDIEATPDLTLTVSSTVPMARGLGSGAALATAMVRALVQHFRRSITPGEVSALVYQTEVIHHGTPSGIDNTVIAFEQPVYFVRGQPIQVLQVGQPFWLAIGDTGVASPTKAAVGDVRRAWQQDPARYEALFDQIGAIARHAREAIAAGEISTLGRLMDENQELLQAIGVSSPELDALVSAAREAGALGAKLCGGGRGGNMIALIALEKAPFVATALRAAGAVNVIVTKVQQTQSFGSRPQASSTL
ncbi:MAG: mevalonate kinase [Chloroflexi bacterium]|nr:mevalonate kinase [Chloroflexota bacterium]